MTDETKYIDKAESTSIAIDPEDADLDLGSKNFTVTFPSVPGAIEFYINKTFKCPVCGHEAEHHTNIKGPPQNPPVCPACFKKANIPVMELKEWTND